MNTRSFVVTAFTAFTFAALSFSTGCVAEGADQAQEGDDIGTTGDELKATLDPNLLRQQCMARGNLYDGESNTCLKECPATYKVLDRGDWPPAVHGGCISPTALKEKCAAEDPMAFAWNAALAVCQQQRCPNGYAANPGKAYMMCKLDKGPTKQECADAYRQWSDVLGTCTEACISGTPPIKFGGKSSCPQATAETAESCNKKDGQWYDGACHGVNNTACDWGTHPTPDGRCEKDAQPAYAEPLPCRKGIDCPTDPTDTSWWVPKK